jgi:hypothetical protein
LCEIIGFVPIPGERERQTLQRRQPGCEQSSKGVGVAELRA